MRGPPDDYEVVEASNPDKGQGFVLYRGGIWKLVAYNRSPDEDLRCGWMGTTTKRPSTWRLQHCYGPNNRSRSVVDNVERDEFEHANEMEVLAYASL